MKQAQASFQVESKPDPLPPIQRIAETMLKILLLEALPMTESRLRKMIPGRKQYKTAALRLLTREARLLRVGAGTKGDPFRYSVNKPAPAIPKVATKEIIL